MGEVDTQRQQLNVFRMELLGAKVVAVTDGLRTLKEAVDAALDDLIKNYKDTYYMLGSAVGPHPYPTWSRHFNPSLARRPGSDDGGRGKSLPDYLHACRRGQQCHRVVCTLL